MLLFKPSPIPADAYRPDRLASDLIKTQVRHALGVESRLPRALRSGMMLNLDTLTEGQAATFLEHITRLSHPAGAPKAAAPRPKPTRRRPTRKPARRKAAAPAKPRKPRRRTLARPAKRSRR